ncbi:hypothetical protein FOA52_007422 [Chlamydomonas sp. UWO 241]|nr:hypothetical protein FOA52_007422 [Chlamydomonas sp. UWO 241]
MGPAPILRDCSKTYAQTHSAKALASIAAHAAVAGTSVFIKGGAIPPLVKMLGPDSHPETQWHAAAALADLAAASADNRAKIAAAGGIVGLFRLAGSRCNPITKTAAARALGLYGNVEIRAAMAAAAPSAK